MGEQKDKSSGMSFWVKVLIGVVVILFFFALKLPSDHHPAWEALTINVCSNARQIHMGVQRAALDRANTGIGTGWPADSGIKNGHEYLQRLVKEGVFKISDLKIFTIPGQIPPTSLETITPEHIGFRIANVSESDPPETIFLVTPNYLNNTPYPFDLLPKWKRFLFSTSRPVVFAVFRKGGDGTSYTRLPSQIPAEVLGILPPREPKFLDP